MPKSLFRLAVLPGDHIGPEVTAEAVKVLEAIGRRYGHRFQLTYDDVGGSSIDKHGIALRKETIALGKRSDAVLFGSVGGPKWDDPRANTRPEDAILGMRAGLGLFANLRPAKLHPALVHLSPLKAEIVQGTDVLFVRELVAGVYFGKPKKIWQDASGMRKSVDTATYTEVQIERCLRVAFEAAQGRRRMVTMADKQNVMATSRLWREVGAEVAKDYPDVKYQAVLADALAMAMLYRPTSYDVIVTDNLFGDILTDEAAVLAGSMGLMPSASFGEALNRLGGRRGLYEPIHGSAPDIAGKGVANPIAAIQSAAMLLRHSLLLEDEANAVFEATDVVIGQGIFTPDIARAGERSVSTSAVGDAVVQAIEAMTGK